MRSFRSLCALGASLALGVGCVRHAPPPAPTSAAPPVKVPAGCEQNLAGTYAHALNDSFRYRATDDGKTLVLEVERGQQAPSDGADGGTAPSEASQRIVLTRTPGGFVGATRALAFPQGAKCEVEFPAELTACTPEGLTLLSADEIAVSASSCARAESAPKPAMVEQRLVRLRAAPAAPGSADGGSPASSGGSDGGSD